MLPTRLVRGTLRLVSGFGRVARTRGERVGNAESDSTENNAFYDRQRQSQSGSHVPHCHHLTNQ
jgi:hypothetical protein